MGGIIDFDLQYRDPAITPPKMVIYACLRLKSTLSYRKFMKGMCTKLKSSDDMSIAEIVSLFFKRPRRIKFRKNSSSVIGTISTDPIIKKGRVVRSSRLKSHRKNSDEISWK
jgi:hypothetical protein